MIVKWVILLSTSIFKLIVVLFFFRILFKVFFSYTEQIKSLLKRKNIGVFLNLLVKIVLVDYKNR